MIEKMLQELKKLDSAENIFGEEFIGSISYAECADGYLVRVKDFPFITVKKEENFNIQYFEFIIYLTDMKNQYMNGETPHDGTSYYYDWMEFRKSYNVRKAWFYLNIRNIKDADEIVESLIDILGHANYTAVVSSFHTLPEDFRGNARIVMNYIGNTRAVRDLSMRYLDDEYGIQWAFHLWHLTAHTLIEKYGYVFYLGNEMSSLEYCPYNYTAREYYYNDLYRKIYQNTKQDIPKNQHLTEEMKQEMWLKIQKEIFGKK